MSTTLSCGYSLEYSRFGIVADYPTAKLVYQSIQITSVFEVNGPWHIPLSWTLETSLSKTQASSSWPVLSAPYLPASRILGYDYARRGISVHEPLPKLFDYIYTRNLSNLIYWYISWHILDLVR